MTDEEVPDYDDDESFADGDIPLDEVDWGQVIELERRQQEALAVPEGEERSMVMLGLLHEMHGDDLEVL